MPQYFIHNGLAEEGPFTIEQLAAKNIKSDTPVWYEGLKEWTTAGEVEELQHILKPVPPPFINAAATPPPPNIPVPQSTKAAPSTKQNNLGRRLLWALSILALTLTVVFVFYKIERGVQSDSVKDDKEHVRKNITFYVTASRNEYTYNTLGGIQDLEITVANLSQYLIDNVKVKITYIKANGDVWTARTYDFNMIDGQTSKTLKIPDTQRGTSIEYEIVSISSKILDL